MISIIPYQKYEIITKLSSQKVFGKLKNTIVPNNWAGILGFNFSKKPFKGTTNENKFKIIGGKIFFITILVINGKLIQLTNETKVVFSIRYRILHYIADFFVLLLAITLIYSNLKKIFIILPLLFFIIHIVQFNYYSAKVKRTLKTLLN